MRHFYPSQNCLVQQLGKKLFKAIWPLSQKNLQKKLPQKTETLHTFIFCHMKKTICSRKEGRQLKNKSIKKRARHLNPWLLLSEKYLNFFQNTLIS